MMSGMARALWNYRAFMAGSVKREFQSKYRNSLLGAAWTVISPLAMIIVYTVIFSQVMRAKLPGIDNDFAYSIYLCAGVLTWGLFAEIVSRGQSVFLENANLIKKISFPRICLPVIVVVNACINFSIVFGLFLVFLLITGSFPGNAFIAFFPILLIQIAFSIGLGMIVATLNVFFRDVGQFFSILLQFWFWLTPVVYPVSILPSEVRPYIDWNPITPIISGYQSIFVYGTWPNWVALILPSALSIFLCIFGVRLFRKHVGEMVDEL